MLFPFIKHVPLRQKIVWMVLPIGILPLLVFGYVSYITVEKALLDQVDEQMTVIVRDLSQRIGSFHEKSEEQLIRGLSFFSLLLERNGTPAIKNDRLVFTSNDGDYVIQDSNEFVDQMLSMLGSQATIFQVRGDKAVRISTNIRLDNQMRAIGTFVSQAVYEQVVMKGLPYIGTADVVGNAYMSVYEPILAENGDVIGILFVGIAENSLFGSVLADVAGIRLGDTGHIFILDGKGQWILKPNNYTHKHDLSSDFRQKITSNTFSSAGEKISVLKDINNDGHVIFHRRIPNTEWTVAAHVNLEEFRGPVLQARDFFAIMLVIFILFSYFIARSIGRYMALNAQRLIQVSDAMTAGQLKKAERDVQTLTNNHDSQDELVLVARSIQTAIHSITVRDAVISASEKRLQTLLDTSLDGIHILNLEGDLKQCSPSFMQLIGVSEHKLRLMNVKDWDESMSAESFPLFLEKLEQNETVFETRFRRITGEYIDVELMAHLVSIDNETFIYASARDITQRKEAEQKLTQQKMRLEATINGTNAGTWEWNLQTGEVRINEQWAHILGYTRSELKPLSIERFQKLALEKDIEGVKQAVRAHIYQNEDTFNAFCRFYRKDGKIVWVHGIGRVMSITDDGKPEWMFGTSLDVTKTKQQEREIAGARDKLMAIANATSAGIVALSSNAEVEFMNPVFHTLYGYRKPDLENWHQWLERAIPNEESREKILTIGQELSFTEVDHENYQHESFEVILTCKDKNQKNILLTMSNTGKEFVLTFSDISEQKRREASISYKAHHDVLTGLPNRALLRERLDHEIKRALRNQQLLCVAFIDLDGFKEVNDQYGHQAGDHVLQTCAQRLLSNIRDVDTAARLGGDEFALVLSEFHSKHDFEILFLRLLNSINADIEYKGHTLSVSCSIGASFLSHDPSIHYTQDSAQLIEQADKAMYNAKLSGKNQFTIFDINEH